MSRDVKRRLAWLLGALIAALGIVLHDPAVAICGAGVSALPGALEW